jgi:hypothetical protein
MVLRKLHGMFGNTRGEKSRGWSLKARVVTRRRWQGRISTLSAVAVTTILLSMLVVAARAADAIDHSAESATLALHKLLDTEWEWRHAQFPEEATLDGDHRYDDRLTDLSPVAVAGRRQHHRECLAARIECRGIYCTLMLSSTCARISCSSR